jgi:anti-sigma B factor antagonist
MELKLDKNERYAVLTVEVENLNAAVAPDLKSSLVDLAKQDDTIHNLILDLSNVKFVDSSGLSAILVGQRLWKGANGSYVLAGVTSESVLKLIKISRLDNILNVVPTISESVDLVMMEELERELKGTEAEDENEEDGLGI